MRHDQTRPPYPPLADIDLQALVDGQLDLIQARHVQETLCRDSVARARYRELQEQRRLLMAWWRQFS